MVAQPMRRQERTTRGLVAIAVGIAVVAAAVAAAVSPVMSRVGNDFAAGPTPEVQARAAVEFGTPTVRVLQVPSVAIDDVYASPVVARVNGVARLARPSAAAAGAGAAVLGVSLSRVGPGGLVTTSGGPALGASTGAVTVPSAVGELSPAPTRRSGETANAAKPNKADKPKPNKADAKSEAKQTAKADKADAKKADKADAKKADAKKASKPKAD